MDDWANDTAVRVNALLVSSCSAGGVTGVAYYLCQDLMALQGVEVDVLVPTCATEKPITKHFDGLKVTYLPDVKSTLAERVLLRGSALKVQQHVEAGQYDIVHIQAAPEWGRY